MTYSETKKDEVLKQGKSKLLYDCKECGKKTEVPFNYDLRHTIEEHHGQFVEGDLEELIMLETDLPEHTQCVCGAVYEIQGREAGLYANYSNPTKKGLSLYSQTIAGQSFGEKEKVEQELEQALKQISAKFIAKPVRV